MSGPRRYPAAVSGPFPAPPRTFTDREGREITLRAHDDASEDVREALIEMYVDFDPADRAQGIPPVGEERIRTWVDTLLDGSDDRGRSGYNVLAWHDERVVGHATLVYDSDEAYELAAELQETFPEGSIESQLADFDEPHATEAADVALYTEPMDAFDEGEVGGGSTDVGDVSQITPTAQFRATTWALGTPAHSWQAVVANGDFGRTAVPYVAKLLAGSVVDLLTDGERLAAARAEFEERTEPYETPLPDGAEPPFELTEE
mgnify:CR=1 FL=1